jgi:amino acid transporter
MARQGFVPKFLGSVHPSRRTPHMAIFALMIVVMVLAMSAAWAVGRCDQRAVAHGISSL